MPPRQPFVWRIPDEFQGPPVPVAEVESPHARRRDVGVRDPLRAADRDGGDARLHNPLVHSVDVAHDQGNVLEVQVVAAGIRARRCPLGFEELHEL